MHFRTVKDHIAVPLHHFGSVVSRMPENIGRMVIAAIGVAGKAGYYVPGSYLRKTVGNYCQATGHTDPWPIYSRMVDNIDESALRFARLHRHGNSELVAHTIVDPSVTEQFRRLDNGKDGFILLVPHCAGAVLSSAGLHAFHPSTLLVREPRAPVRCQLMMEYVKKLGPDFILARNTPPATVMRQIMRALKNHRVVVGTTDVVNSGNDTVEVTAFGQRIFSPAWPARLSARLGVPILPGFIHMDNGNFVLLADEGFVAQDLQASTQRWMSSFERRFRQYPSDWVFMLDKHWSKVMANAAAAAKSRVTSPGVSAPAS